MSPNARDGGEGGWGASANEYSCAHGAQKNFGDLTSYLTYAFNKYHLLNLYEWLYSGERGVRGGGRQVNEGLFNFFIYVTPHAVPCAYSCVRVICVNYIILSIRAVLK
jgi:hypothetical protein